MSKIYYRAGSDKKGRSATCQSVVQKDETRVKFLEKLQANGGDNSFRNKKLRWTKHPVEQYVLEYQDRAKTGGNFIHGPDVMMIDTLYELGTQNGYEGETKVKVIKENGQESKFLLTETCVWDASHMESLPPDDVCNINGFGEAALLLAMQRRLCEMLNIYTYVGDVVICINPYMYLPEMVDIAEPPNVKQYTMGQDPSSYSSAHFAYWGTQKPEEYSIGAPRDQSCIVSGESGAGKTVACGFIMKYLAKLSTWRKQELGLTETGGKNVTKLVAGVSPFLEAFGNAKTTMNDNSSRFGKFMKICFHDGMICGAQFVHYLLEKARLTDQGVHERNYHCFYFLIKGATPEETAEFKLKTVMEYDMLMHGNTPIIDHETNKDGTNTYDSDRFNNALHDDPDDTGTRAALTAANVSNEVQHSMWSCLAAILKMGNMDFVAAGDAGCTLKNEDEAKEIAAALGCPSEGAEAFDKMMVIFRRIMPGGKNLDAPVKATGASDNRNALSKDIYGRIFAWLFEVSNDVLEPEAEPEAFVGLLDIFGFEVFVKNSIEQLCINFANEMLQKLFNNHVFEGEKKVYAAEGLDDSVIPPYRDNTPCCNLVIKKSKTFMGLFPLLDDQSANDKNTDAKYCALLIKKFGRNKGMYKKAKSQVEKNASEYFYAKKGSGNNWFVIRHFAGDVKYYVINFLSKNKDRLPVQLTSMMKASTNDYVNMLYNPKKKAKGKELKTIAGKFKKQLGELASTLNATNPHYVRCLKPNDCHMRPVDGQVAYNHWKTYRQLLYAGVMEVCRIKKEGYPFREDYASFWKNRAVKNDWHKLLQLDADGDPKAMSEALCQQVLPGPETDKDGNTKLYWTLGNSLLFGKDTTLDMLAKWHQGKVVSVVQDWWRITSLCLPLREALHAKEVLVYCWKEKLRLRRLAKVETQVIVIQSLARIACSGAKDVYIKRRDVYRAKQTFVAAFRKYHNWKKWDKTGYALGRVAIVKASAKIVQAAQRKHHAYVEFFKLWRGIVHVGAMSEYEAFFNTEVSLVKKKLAVQIMGQRLKLALTKLRMMSRVQAHCRGFCARQRIAHERKLLEIQRLASYKVEALYRMKSARSKACAVSPAVVKIQSVARMFLHRVGGILYTYDTTSGFWHDHHYPVECIADYITALVKVQAFARHAHARISFLARREAIFEVQKMWRFLHMRAWYRKEKLAALRIDNWWFNITLKKRLEEWNACMRLATIKCDITAMAALLALDGPDDEVQEHGIVLGHITLRDVPEAAPSYFWRLQPLIVERVPYKGKNKIVDTYVLVNLRDKGSRATWLHNVLSIGNPDAVTLLLENHIEVDTQDSLLQTPLHLSCAAGDDMLNVSKQIFAKATKRFKFDPEQYWILSKAVRSSMSQTVLDVAMECTAEKKNMLTWLLEQDAKGAVDVEEELEKEEELKRKEKKEARAIAEKAERLANDARSKNPVFTYLMMDKTEDDRVTIKIRKEKERKKIMVRREHEDHMILVLIHAIQAIVRGWLHRKGFTGHVTTNKAMLAKNEERREVMTRVRAAKRAKQKKQNKEFALRNMTDRRRIEQNKKLDAESAKRRAALELRMERRGEVMARRKAELKRKKNEERKAHAREAKAHRAEQAAAGFAMASGLNEFSSAPLGASSTRVALQSNLRSPLRFQGDGTNTSTRSLRETKSPIEKMYAEYTPYEEPPSEWSPRKDHYGHTYYLNKKTQKTTREIPRELSERARALKLHASTKQYEPAAVAAVHSREAQKLLDTQSVIDHEKSDIAANIAEAERLSQQIEELKKRQRYHDAAYAHMHLDAAGKRIVSDDAWYYTDEAQDVHGPFAAEMMRQWFVQGHFSLTLPIRQGRFGPFNAIRQTFAEDIGNAFMR